jgi:hypothetical protein
LTSEKETAKQPGVYYPPVRIRMTFDDVESRIPLSDMGGLLYNHEEQIYVDVSPKNDGSRN